jgi:hypothetical protein
MSKLNSILLEPAGHREWWHEAGHAVVAHHVGIVVQAIGLQWIEGRDDPNPCTWVDLTGIDNDSIAVHVLGGIVAESIKLADYDYHASESDLKRYRELKTTRTYADHYYHASDILRKENDTLVRVHEVLLREMSSPSRHALIDSDGIQRQIYITKEEFAALCE